VPFAPTNNTQDGRWPFSLAGKSSWGGQTCDDDDDDDVSERWWCRYSDAGFQLQSLSTLTSLTSYDAHI
jgi:hypothetical protein